MALCSNQGLDINLDYSDKEQVVPKLFSEEIGLVIEVKNEKLESVRNYLNEKELFFENIAKKNDKKKININCFKEEVFSEDLITLFNQWSKVSHEIQKIRDELKDRVGVLEKWRHVLIGGAIVVGFILNKFMVVS